MNQYNPAFEYNPTYKNAFEYQVISPIESMNMEKISSNSNPNMSQITNHHQNLNVPNSNLKTYNTKKEDESTKEFLLEVVNHEIQINQEIIREPDDRDLANSNLVKKLLEDD